MAVDVILGEGGGGELGDLGEDAVLQRKRHLQEHNSNIRYGRGK